MPDETETQSPSPEKEQLDAVSGALEKLRQNGAAQEVIDGLAREELLELAGRIEQELREKKLKLSGEKLKALRSAMTIETKERLEEGSIEQKLQDLELRELEKRLETIEKAAMEQSSPPGQSGRTGPPPPEWMGTVGGFFSEYWKKFRSLPHVGETIDWIEGVTGKAWRSAGDVWETVKGFVFGAIAQGDFAKNIPFVGPRISEWARAQLEQQAVLGGIQQAVKDAQSKGIAVNFINASTETDWNRWITVLRNTGGSSDPRTATISYVANFIDREKAQQDKKPPEQRAGILVTLETLTRAHLSPSPTVNPVPLTPEIPQNLFGITGLKLNHPLSLTEPKQITVGNAALRLASDSITYRNVRYLVKIEGQTPSTVSLTPRDAANAAAMEIRYNAGDLFVTVGQVLEAITAASTDTPITVSHITLEKHTS